MDYKVIINPEYTSNNSINTFNKKVSSLLNDKLNSINVKSTIISKNSNSEKINSIKSLLNNNSIVVTNGLGSDNIEIVYGLNDKDNLASRLSNNLEDNDFLVGKYYQRRDSKNTNLDYDPIIREIPNNESIIIKLGNINDNQLNRIDDIVSIIANTLKSYLGLASDYYVVQSGDNLYSIARKFNTTVDTIKRLNNLTSNTLSIGQKILIKSIPSTIKDENEYYIVKKGDSLYSIALKYNMTVQELKSINNLSTNLLSTGQRLKVSNKEFNNTYKVVNGDTLYSIARRYNISTDELKKLNNLTSNTLSIGQVLRIPSNNVIEYIVKSGDNLYKISNMYNISIKDIMNLNNLKNTNLSINQKLIIPKNK